MKTNLLYAILFLAALALQQESKAQITGQNPLMATNKNNGYDPILGKLPVEQDDLLGRYQIRGWVADGFYHAGAEIRSIVTGPVQPGGFPANLQLRTGFPDLVTRIAITAEGRVGVGTVDPGFDLDVAGNTHTSGNFFGRIHFDDNGSADAAPGAYTDEAYFERHALAGFATAPASTTVEGGLFTLAPGGASQDHQLFFADDGLFHRREAAGAGSWGNPWEKLLSSGDINGTPNMVAKFTAPSSLGDSHIYDDGTRIGLHTSSPDINFDVDIKGDTKADGSLTVTGSAFVGSALGVGTISVPSGFKLAVDGNVICEELRVLLSPSWPDYVFGADYQLMPLDEVEKAIATHGRLPGIPSAREIESEGLPVGAITAGQQEKIEEAFLHLIEMNKQLQALQKENARLKERLEKLEHGE